MGPLAITSNSTPRSGRRGECWLCMIAGAPSIVQRADPDIWPGVQYIFPTEHLYNTDMELAQRKAADHSLCDVTRIDDGRRREPVFVVSSRSTIADNESRAARKISDGLT
jgi:hypothetical protein